MKLTLNEAVARFGESAKKKLANPSAIGQPEDQLRAPVKALLAGLAESLQSPPVPSSPGPLISSTGLAAAGAFELPPKSKMTSMNMKQEAPGLFESEDNSGG